MGYDDYHCHRLLPLGMLLPRWIDQGLLFVMLLLPNANVHAAAIAMIDMEANLMRVSHGSRDSAATRRRHSPATASIANAKG